MIETDVSQSVVYLQWQAARFVIYRRISQEVFWEAVAAVDVRTTMIPQLVELVEWQVSGELHVEDV
jgi:hypothetical protein